MSHFHVLGRHLHAASFFCKYTKARTDITLFRQIQILGLLPFWCSSPVLYIRAMGVILYYIGKHVQCGHLINQWSQCTPPPWAYLKLRAVAVHQRSCIEKRERPIHCHEQSFLVGLQLLSQCDITTHPQMIIMLWENNGICKQQKGVAPPSGTEAFATICRVQSWTGSTIPPRGACGSGDGCCCW